MIFNVYEKDTWQIVQSNKIFSPDGHDAKLHEVGQLFVKAEGEGPLDMDKIYAPRGELTARPFLVVEISKTEIRAGGVDGARLTGPFAGALVTVSTGNMQIHQEVVQGNQIYITIPVPCVYHLTIRKWPYQDFACDIRAVR